MMVVQIEPRVEQLHLIDPGELLPVIVPLKTKNLTLEEAAQQRIDMYDQLRASNDWESAWQAGQRWEEAFKIYADIADYSQSDRDERLHKIHSKIDTRMRLVGSVSVGGATWHNTFDSTQNKDEEIIKEHLFDPDHPPKIEEAINDVNLPTNTPTAAELLAQLQTARQEYAVLAAHKRSQYIGRAAISKSTKQRLFEAKNDYINAHTAVILDLLARADSNKPLDSYEQVAELHNWKNELVLLEGTITQERLKLADSKRFRAFYSWWARQGGGRRFLHGKVQKSVVMGGIGVASGLVFGTVSSLAVALIGGPVTGGVLAGTLAKSVSRGLAAGKVNKESAAYTVAEAQAEYRLANQEAEIERYMSTIDQPAPRIEDIIAQVELSTQKEVKRNRTRLLGSVALGLAGGLVGAWAGHYLHDHLSFFKHKSSNPKHTPNQPHQPSSPPHEAKPAPTTPPNLANPPLPSNPSVVPQPNVEQWSWSVAHELHPGHEIMTINQALVRYSAETGHTAQLVPHAGTTMIQVGNHIVTPVEMIRINEIMTSSN